MSLTTIDKQDIKVMIEDGIENSPTINLIHTDINRLEDLVEGNSTDINRLEGLVEGNSTEVSRLGVLNEDISHKVDAILEIVGVLADSSQRLENHETRLVEIESKQPLIINTLKLHSKQLGTKT